MTFPQYAKTTNADVIAAVERNRHGIKDWRERAVEFSKAHGSEKGAFYPSEFAGGHAVRAIATDTKPTSGQWKAGHGGYGYLPYVTNPLFAEFEAITFEEEAVPGLPFVVDGPFIGGGQHVVGTPRPFVVDGVAYVGFSFVPTNGEEDIITAAGWTEVKASEFHAALETYNERVTAAHE